MTLTEEGLVDVPGMDSRWVRLGSGALAHYMTSGSSGPAVVLVHGGLPGSSGTAGWRFTAPYLAEHGFRVYCPDMPGFGLADTSPEHWSAGLDGQVDFLQEFTTALNIKRFHLAGNSMGCMVSSCYLVNHPERVVSFALIAGEFGDVTERLTRPVRKNPNLSRWDGTREGMRSMMSAIIHKSEAVTDDLVDMRYQAAVRQKEANAAMFNDTLAWRDGRLPDPNKAVRLTTKGRLDKLTIPGVYLYGMDDVLSPVEWGYEQETVLPNVQFFFPEDCGHQGQTDRPDLFNPLFVEFFRDGVISRATADAAGVSKRRPELSHLVASE